MAPKLPRPALLLIACVAAQLARPVAHAKNYDLSPEEKASFKQHLPNTYAKLSVRAPLHVISLGDSITDLYTLDENCYDWVLSFPAVFLEKLSDQFFYTGGVRLTKTASKEHKDKRLPTAGPEITLRNLAQDGATAYMGTLRSTTVAYESKPDLVIINYGINDAQEHVPQQRYLECMAEIIDLAKENGAECIVLGCTLSTLEPPGLFLGVSRPFASALQELAAEKGALFVDLGDPSHYVGELERHEKPEDLLPRVTSELNSGTFLFDNGEADNLHPNVQAHRRMGNAIFKGLLGTTEPPALQLAQTTATLGPEGKITLRGELQNTGETDATCHIAPLWISYTHMPEAPPFACEIPAEGSFPIEINYTPDPVLPAHPLPSGEPYLRIPLLVSSSSQTTILTAKAALAPAGITWKTGLHPNLEDTYTAQATITNHGENKLSQNYTATWNGQKIKGKVEIPPGASQDIEIPIPLPEDPDILRQEGLLELDFGDGARFTRNLCISKNMPLKTWLPLACYAGDTEGEIVQFRADADSKALFFSYDLQGMEAATYDGIDSIFVDLTIDARPYGKRYISGGVRSLGFHFPTPGDGAGTVDKIQVGAFGNGYSAQLANTGITAQLSTRPNGNRRITIAIPSKYFYLHEYGQVPEKVIGNGNSQFGINTTVYILDPATAGEDGATPPIYTDRRRFGHARPRTHPKDAEGLSILELASPGTSRWSARLF